MFSKLDMRDTVQRFAGKAVAATSLLHVIPHLYSEPPLGMELTIISVKRDGNSEGKSFGVVTIHQSNELANNLRQIVEDAEARMRETETRFIISSSG